MIITLLFCVEVKWKISHQSSLFPKPFMALTEDTNFIWKHSDVIVETFKTKSILQFQGIILHNPFAQSWCLHLHLATLQQLAFALGTISWEFDCTPITQLVIKILKEYCAWFCQAVWSNLFLLLLSCIVNLFSESAFQEEGCCTIVRDQYSSWGSTEALNGFLPQKNISRMTRGRSRKRHQSLRESTDE
jgi:hypothetical protein